MEAVKIAISTMIIKAVSDMDAEDIEKQIIETTSKHHYNVPKMKRIKSGIKLICEDANESLKIKEKINSNTEVRAAVQLKTASIRKKLMIFNIPDYVTEQQIEQKIKRTLGLGPKDIEDVVSLLRHMEPREGKKRQPVLLHEPLEYYLRTMNLVCLGFKDCPVKNFISIRHCHRYLK